MSLASLAGRHQGMQPKQSMERRASSLQIALRALATMSRCDGVWGSLLARHSTRCSAVKCHSAIPGSVHHRLAGYSPGVCRKLGRDHRRIYGLPDIYKHLNHLLANHYLDSY
eukprot:scaffold302438_cov12-Prasinocladus_malaysianus.AAC.1